MQSKNAKKHWALIPTKIDILIILVNKIGFYFHQTFHPKNASENSFTQ